MNTRLIEKFIEENFEGKFNTTKNYCCGNLASIEIFPTKGRKIYIWNEDFIKDAPFDSKDLVEMNMQILYENLLRGKKQDMADMINYFLVTEYNEAAYD